MKKDYTAVDYDDRTASDAQGSNKGVRMKKEEKGRGVLGEFWPTEAKAKAFSRIGQIGKQDYPDTEPALAKEQNGDVKTSDRDRAPSNRRR